MLAVETKHKPESLKAKYYPGEGHLRRGKPLVWTPKQRLLWDAIYGSAEGTNQYDTFYAYGAAGTGKTEALVYFFLAWAALYHAEGDFIISGYQFRQTMHVVGSVLLQFCADNDLEWYKQGERYFEITGEFNGRDINLTFHTFAGHDKKGANSALGYNIRGVLLDEVEQMHEEFIDNILDRTRGEGMHTLIFGTANPTDFDSYPYRNWVDIDEEDKAYIYTLKFNLHEDNTSGEQYYHRQLRRYKNNRIRMVNRVDGDYMQSENAVYPFFDKRVVDQFPKRELLFRIITVDFAITGETNAVLMHHYSGDMHMAVKECVITKDELLDVPEIWERIHNELIGVRRIDKMIVDPATSMVFKKYAREQADFPIVNGENAVEAGIDAVTILMNNRQLYVHRSCTVLVKQMTNYRFKYEEDEDDKSGQTLKRTVIKVRDHGPDALRYYVLTHAIQYNGNQSVVQVVMPPTKRMRVPWLT